MSLHDCHRRIKFNAYVKEMSGDMNKFVCLWPKCNCPLSSVSGAFHNEKFDWIIQERTKDLKFKHRIKI